MLMKFKNSEKLAQSDNSGIPDLTICLNTEVTFPFNYTTTHLRCISLETVQSVALIFFLRFFAAWFRSTGIVILSFSLGMHFAIQTDHPHHDLWSTLKLVLTWDFKPEATPTVESFSWNFTRGAT